MARTKSNRPPSDLQPSLFDGPEVIVDGCLPNILNKAVTTLLSVGSSAPIRDSEFNQRYRNDLLEQIKRDVDTLAAPLDPLTEWWREFYNERLAACRRRYEELR